MNITLETTFKSNATVLKDVRNQIREFCKQQKINKSTTENIILAVNEACMNIIQHGYYNNPDNEFSISASIENNENKKELVIQLIDHAKKIDPSKIKSRELEDVKPGGIGVHIIHKLMDSAVYLTNEQKTGNNTGNILELRKTL